MHIVTIICGLQRIQSLNDLIQKTFVQKMFVFESCGRPQITTWLLCINQSPNSEICVTVKIYMYLNVFWAWTNACQKEWSFIVMQHYIYTKGSLGAIFFTAVHRKPGSKILSCWCYTWESSLTCHQALALALGTSGKKKQAGWWGVRRICDIPSSLLLCGSGPHSGSCEDSIGLIEADGSSSWLWHVLSLDWRPLLQLCAGNFRSPKV